MLDVERLTVQFGGLRAVDALSFSIARSEVVGLIGPNGAGKTTCFNALTGFVRASDGTVRFLGQDLTGMPPHVSARAGLVRTWQKRSFFPNISILENVLAALTNERAPDGDDDGNGRRRPARLAKLLATGWAVEGGTGAQRAEREQRAVELLELVGLADRRHDVASSLPYGEQRVLGVAMALGVRPELLMLDEPCAGMTHVEIERMVALIGKLRELGMTLLVVEHRMRFLMGISDRVIVLDHGVKLAEGRPKDISENPEVITAYLGGSKTA